jgi:hypothetical protein
MRGGAANDFKAAKHCRVLCDDGSATTRRLTEELRVVLLGIEPALVHCQSQAPVVDSVPDVVTLPRR